MKSDLCAYQKELSQSTSPINYTLDPNKFYNCSDCRSDFGLIGGNNVSTTQNNMVDLESDLYGITRQNTRCPERKYLPHCHQCAEVSGIPCDGWNCPSMDSVQHLPQCKIIQYSPRVDHIGYNIQYPVCGHDKGMVYPPQRNPTHFVVK
jgi:hypothetical protein